MPSFRTRARAVVVVLALIVPMIPASGATSGGWSNLGAAGKGMTNIVGTMVVAGTRLYAGGNFTNVAGIAEADYVAVWNGTKWSAVGGGLNGLVESIAVDGSNVYVGGQFLNAGGVGAADHLAKWNGTSWSAVGGVGLNDAAFALRIHDGYLYAGGTFTDVDGIAEADGIARFDLVGSGGWEALTPSGGQIGGVRDFDVSGDTLFIGGGFQNAAGVAEADYVATYDTITGTWGGLGASDDLNNTVQDVAVDGDGLYIAGHFSDADGIAAADKIAHWTGSAWEALGGGGGGLSEDSFNAYSILRDSDTIFVAGYFYDVDGNTKLDAVMALRGGTWRNVGTGFYGGPVNAGPFYDMTVLGNDIVVGGVPVEIGDNALANYIASFRIRQPDATIAIGTGAAVGNNVYNTTGASQTVNVNAARGATKSFTIKIANDGFVADGIKVKGPGTANGFTITYLAGATDVTAQVVAGTYTLAPFAPGSAKTLTLKVKVGAGVAVGATKGVLVKATSTGLGAPVDAVKAVVKVT